MKDAQGCGARADLAAVGDHHGAGTVRGTPEHCRPGAGDLCQRGARLLHPGRAGHDRQTAGQPLGVLPYQPGVRTSTHCGRQTHQPRGCLQAEASEQVASGRIALHHYWKLSSRPPCCQA
ncbi:hypothetical protein [Streptomyces umbrinus]|uniref:hypothetical protein n=1 Tax=Streptomyces umbrinus TaxID=67370 RepID=UPI003419F76B